MFSEEHHNRGNKKMEGIKRNYLYLVILAVVDLIALLATYIFEIYAVFSILLLISIVLVAVIVAVILFSPLFKKQAVGSEEYYEAIIKKQNEHVHFDDHLLGKMFEMRITNRRNSLLAYLAFMLTYTLTITLGSEKICPDSTVVPLVLCRLTVIICALVGVLSIGILAYHSARLDRYAIDELDELFKAMNRLDKIEKESDPENQNP